MIELNIPGRGLLKLEHLLTADAHGKQHIIDQQLGLQAVRIPPGDESEQKVAYVRQLGADSVVAIGQSANDAGMLKEATLGICLLSKEGLAADLLAPDIFTAFELLEHPLRIVTSLRT